MPDATETKVIMIMGCSKAARATTLKMVERGNTVVLVCNEENQTYLDEMGGIIKDMGGQSMEMGVDCNNLLEVQAMFEAILTRFKNVNSFLHFSKGFGKMNPEILEYLQDKVNPVTGTTTCTMTDKWISTQALGEMGQSILPEELRFPEFVTQRVLGIREFEARETYHLIDPTRALVVEEKKPAPPPPATPATPASPKGATATPARRGSGVPGAPPARPAPPPPETPVRVVAKAAPPPPATPAKCPHCGKIPNSGVFCNFCGKKK